jgi:hypothetical protein
MELVSRACRKQKLWWEVGMEEIGHGGCSSRGYEVPFDKTPALWRLQVQG